jgi:protein involved in polysaccharide export with SLBB domain
MKKFPFIIALLIGSSLLVCAQGQVRERRADDPESSPAGAPTSSRSRIVSAPKSNHVENNRTASPSDVQPATENRYPAGNQVRSRWGNTPVESTASADDKGKTTQSPFNAAREANAGETSAVRPIQKTASLKEQNSGQSVLANPDARIMNPNRALSPTSVYRVGVGDVLDVRLSNLPTRESTLFTVLKNGTLEYPLLDSPIVVAGMTADEIANRLSNEIKVIQTARVSVSVRDFASHAVVVTGTVDNPGRKILRREAMPLFALLAEALPRPEASLATITRGDKEQNVPLNDSQAMSVLVLPGDIIRVSGGTAVAKRFIYIAGSIVSPGEKEFHEGMTLTQALISAGGPARVGKVGVKISRRNSKGFLIATEYDLRSIEDGKSQDPLLEAGDRLEVNTQ